MDWTPDMTTPEAVEALARAMCVELGEDPDSEWRQKIAWVRFYLAARQAEAKAATDKASERDAVMADAAHHGMGFMQNGKRLDPRDVLVFTPEAPAGRTGDDEIYRRAREQYLGLPGGLRPFFDETQRLTRANTPPKLTEDQVMQIVHKVRHKFHSASAAPYGIDGAVRETLRLAGVLE